VPKPKYVLIWLEWTPVKTGELVETASACRAAKAPERMYLLDT
jgi:hypothetical protein